MLSTSLHQITSICYQYQLHQITRSFVININFIRSLDHLLSISTSLDHQIICYQYQLHYQINRSFDINSTSLDHQVICYQYQLHQITGSFVINIIRSQDHLLININFIRSLDHLLSISTSLDHICYQYQLHYQIIRSFGMKINFIRSLDHMLSISTSLLDQQII